MTDETQSAEPVDAVGQSATGLRDMLIELIAKTTQRSLDRLRAEVDLAHERIATLEAAAGIAPITSRDYERSIDHRVHDIVFSRKRDARLYS